MKSNMEEFTKQTLLLIALLFFVVNYQVVECRIHKLKLEADDRRQFTFSTFGFLKKGTLLVNVTKFKYKLESPKHNVDINTFGFTLDKSQSIGVSGYMEGMQETCILSPDWSKSDGAKDDSFSMVFFRLNLTESNNSIVVERRGKDVQNLVISTESREDFWSKHHIQRRDTFGGLQGTNIMSDSYLFNNRRKRETNTEPPPKSKPLKSPPEDADVGKDTDAGKDTDEGKNADVGKDTESGKDAEIKKTKEGEENKIDTEEAGKKKEDAKTGEDKSVINGTGSKTAGSPQEVSSVSTSAIPIEFDEKGEFYKFHFIVGIMDEEAEGMYNLYFHNCLNYQKESTSKIFLSLSVIEDNNGNYLSAGEMPIPSLFFILTVVYLIVGLVWISFLRKSDEKVYKLHYLMFAVVLVKSLACLLHAMNSHFIQNKGFHEEAWAVLYYIAYLMRGALLFITILLIGAGWAFIKHMLSDKEKKLFLIIIPLQVLDNIAWIIVEESEEGQSQYTIWKEIFILVDLLCCGAILFPVVWSIRHLQQASTVDGKAAVSLQKLKLFRQFYILIVCYIYFTRIIVYLLKLTVPFRYEWLNELFRELATIVFFVVTGYKFRPATDNPYLQVPQDSDDEMEMEEVLTRSGATDTVVRVNKGKNSEQESQTTMKQRESSHEYD